MVILLKQHFVNVAKNDCITGIEMYHINPFINHAIMKMFKI